MVSSLNAVISTNESTEFKKGHVIYNPAYIYKFQLKTTFVHYWNFVRCWNFDCWNFDYWNFDSLNSIIVCTFLLSYFYWFYMEILTLQIQTLEYMRLRFVLKLSKCEFWILIFFVLSLVTSFLAAKNFFLLHPHEN